MSANSNSTVSICRWSSSTFLFSWITEERGTSSLCTNKWCTLRSLWCTSLSTSYTTSLEIRTFTVTSCWGIICTLSFNTWCSTSGITEICTLSTCSFKLFTCLLSPLIGRTGLSWWNTSNSFSQTTFHEWITCRICGCCSIILTILCATWSRSWCRSFTSSSISQQCWTSRWWSILGWTRSSTRSASHSCSYATS